MMLSRRTALAFSVLTIWTATASAVAAQDSLVDLLRQHGVAIDRRGIEGAFDDDERIEPVNNRTGTLTGGLAPGALAMPLAVFRSGDLRERTEAAYAFGILAGDLSGLGSVAPSREVAAGVSAMLELIASPDRRARVAAARVLGRVLFVHRDVKPGPYPNGVLEALFGLLNSDNDIEQLAAMDALGLMRASSAVTSLTERYTYYRNEKKRALAGGALEALVRIGDPSTAEIVRQLSDDRWSEGKDAAALVVAFARARFFDDRSAGAVIANATREKSRGLQATRYARELIRAVP